MGRSILREWFQWLLPIPLYFSPLGMLLLTIVTSLRARAEPRAFYIFVPIWLSVIGLVRSPMDMVFFGLFVLEGYFLTKLRPSTYVSVDCVVSIILTLAIYYGARDFLPSEVNEAWKAETEKVLTIFLDDGAFKRFDWLDSKTRPEQLQFLTEAFHLFFLGFQIFLSVVNCYLYAAFTKSKDRFRDFRSKDWCIWLFIFFFGLYLLPYEACSLPARAGLAALVPLYFFQGLAIVTAFLGANGIAGFWRIVVLVLVLYTLHFFVFLLGLFDLWFDFRRRLEVKD